MGGGLSDSPDRPFAQKIFILTPARREVGWAGGRLTPQSPNRPEHLAFSPRPPRGKVGGGMAESTERQENPQAPPQRLDKLADIAEIADFFADLGDFGVSPTPTLWAIGWGVSDSPVRPLVLEVM